MHDSLNGIILHGDDIGRHECIDTLMLLGKRLHDILGSYRHDSQIGIGGKRGLDTGHDNSRLLVAAHDVNANTNLIHELSLYSEMADSKSRPCLFQIFHAMQNKIDDAARSITLSKSYSVTMTSRSL